MIKNFLKRNAKAVVVLAGLLIILAAVIAGVFLTGATKDAISYHDDMLLSSEENVEYLFVPVSSLPPEVTLYTVREGKVYIQTASGEKLYHSDAQNLELTIKRRGSSILYIPGYERDNEGILGLPEADRETFRFMGNGYGIDKSHVYWQQKIIEGFKPSTFRFVGILANEEYYATDEEHVYLSACGVPDGCWTAVIDGADPKTFALVPEELSRVSLTRDESNVYCSTTRLQNLKVNMLSTDTREFIHKAIVDEFTRTASIDTCPFVDGLFK